MLLPEKHITLAESLIGLGSFVLSQLDVPRSIDELWDEWIGIRGTPEFPAYHSFENLVLAVDFLYLINAVTLTQEGEITKCHSNH